MVAEQYLGVPVKCGRCGRSFTTRTDASAAPIRLDIGAAGTSGRFLTQHLVYWNLDERHELAGLVVAGGQELGSIAAALMPLLNRFLAAASPDAASAAASINAAVVVIIWDGQVSIGGVAERPICHHSGGRLTRLRRTPVKLAAGDWLVLAGDSSQPPLDESALQRQIAAATSSAAALAEQLVGRGGTFLVVRAY
jgi:hypothetical protein